MKNKKFILIVLIPIFLHLMIFMIGPIIGGLAISFFDYNPLRSDNHFVGLDNFVRLVQLISMFKSNKTRSLFRMIFFLPCVAPLVASSVVWAKSILPTTNGLANMALRTLGLAEVNWLGNPDVLMWSIIVFSIWADIGYNIILFTAGIDGIPGEFYEAADLDGASGWQKFRHITLPLLKRTFTFVTIMTLISHFQAFAQFAVMAVRNGPQNSGLVLTSYIYKTAFETKDMGYASAISLALFMIIMVVSLIQQRANKVEWEY